MEEYEITVLEVKLLKDIFPGKKIKCTGSDWKRLEEKGPLEKVECKELAKYAVKVLHLAGGAPIGPDIGYTSWVYCCEKHSALYRKIFKGKWPHG